MKAFWDSNAVLDLLLAGREAQTHEVPARATGMITQLVAAECVRTAWHESALTSLRDAIPVTLATRWVDCTPDWKPWREGLAALARRFGTRLNAGTNDLLHLVAAEHSGCDAFVSLDVHSGLRAMAHVLGFRVYPTLDSLPAKDSPLLRKLRF